MNPKDKISVLEILQMVPFLIARGEMHIALIAIFKMGGETLLREGDKIEVIVINIMRDRIYRLIEKTIVTIRE
ncbi:hypothetical protein TNIN_480621, partial [Trichonephila inaurata madagascariensis]